jgi:hypothetical protein
VKFRSTTSTPTSSLDLLQLELDVPWVTACESTTEPTCADAPLHEHFPFGLCNASRAHAEALIARQASKEIISDYGSESNPGSGYYSDSSYEFDFGSDPDEPKSDNPATEQP